MKQVDRILKRAAKFNSVEMNDEDYFCPRDSPNEEEVEEREEVEMRYEEDSETESEAGESEDTVGPLVRHIFGSLFTSLEKKIDFYCPLRKSA